LNKLLTMVPVLLLLVVELVGVYPQYYSVQENIRNTIQCRKISAILFSAEKRFPRK
jgi:hypothetical protein